MNKINYDKAMQEILSEVNKDEKLLLHSCCAPCSSYCLTEIGRKLKVTVFYYNPNLDSEEEYNLRMSEQKRFISQYEYAEDTEFVEIGYENDDFEKAIKGLENQPEGGARCFVCYRLRMEKTAEYAKNNGYDYFATTLTVSPLKNAEKINAIGFELGKKYGIKYLPTDFKKRNGYAKSVELSKEYGLYRQNYCGCKYGKAESNLINNKIN